MHFVNVNIYSLHNFENSLLMAKITAIWLFQSDFPYALSDLKSYQEADKVVFFFELFKKYKGNDKSL